MTGNKKCFAGVDMGSVTVGAAVIDHDGHLIGHAVERTGARSADTAGACLEQALQKAGITMDDVAFIVGTGYGRIAFPLANTTVTEITCQARGIHHQFPKARTVLDIGGQDAKVIRLQDTGRVMDFAMNDKCAAGTGRFLEVMAGALQVPLDELGNLALSTTEEAAVSSTCTVFAESEVVGQVARGSATDAIARGLHRSIAKRFVALANRVGITPDVVLTGGVARNPAVKQFLTDEMNITEILTPQIPQITCACGAALIARDKATA